MFKRRHLWHLEVILQNLTTPHSSVEVLGLTKG